MFEPASGRAARRLLVSGRVQGVGYRYFVSREAAALDLSGWVRNLADGRVEILAAGAEARLDTLIGRLWQGPPHAHVSAVDASPAEEPAERGFRVLPTAR